MRASPSFEPESDEIDTACSPDGLWVVFASDRDGNREIYVIRIDGTSLRRLTNHPAMDINPEWSPDGTRIAFESDAGAIEIRGRTPERGADRGRAYWVDLSEVQLRHATSQREYDYESSSGRVELAFEDQQRPELLIQ